VNLKNVDDTATDNIVQLCMSVTSAGRRRESQPIRSRHAGGAYQSYNTMKVMLTNQIIPRM